MDTVRDIDDSRLRLVAAVLLGSVVWVGVGFAVRTVVRSGYGPLAGLGVGVVAGYAVWRGI
jgi:hypothetical protein